MDSLLANYASSDDDDGDAEVSRPVLPPKVSPSTASVAPPKSSSLFSSLPLPRTSISTTSSSPSSSLFTSLPPPRSHLPRHSLNDDLTEEGEGNPSRQPPPSSIFSSLPPPKTASSSSSSSLPANNLPSDQKLKRIVHFTLPLNPSLLKSQDSDDDANEEEMRRKLKKNDSSSSTSKALSSMLPAPKNSLCIAPAQSSGAASRRSSLQADISSPKHAQEWKEEQKSESYTNYTNYDIEQGEAAGYYDNYGSYTAEHGVTDYENYTNGSVDLTYADNPTITPWEQVNGNGVGYGSYMDNLTIVSRGEKQFEGIIAGKRGRADIPTEIVEVKQDELMKNRPREDQVKLTGIAFGPAYQAAPSGKGKPTKLHKRKHQIGSLYYDLKQKEMELAERRSKGLLTKAETQAKYGW
ncbi:hypothetical protein KSP39_PZI022419 [Platanthera zijinensis]|uniref:Proline-rich protein PRCC n=1 Tax=Platanthera zijinensis TaxID=2320716 RepID=A0AAP0AWA6_9ASPA